MAIVKLFSQFSFLQPQDWDFVVTTNTATSLVLANASLGLQQSFTGSFTYDTLGNVSGRVTSTTFSLGGNTVYTATGLNHDAARLQDFAEATGDTQQMYAFVLQGADAFEGSQGNDTINGYGGNDTMLGGNGNDVLNGGAGADEMNGNGGNDTYYIAQAGDRAVEESPSGFDEGGVDRVISTISHTLANFVENLALIGGAAIHGTGNSLANAITGNGAANTLRGGGGNDVLRGSGGADLLFGGAGADVLIGGLGKDRMSGGLGRDTFDFNALTELGTSRASTDLVADFTQGQDKIDLAGLDANGALAGNSAFSFIGTSAFGANATGQLRYLTDTVTGQTVIEGSTDADAAAEFVIVLTGVKTLLATDFAL